MVTVLRLISSSFSCKITSTYSDDDSSSCKLLSRPSVSILQLHLMSLFASGIVMASFVFTPSTVEIWARFFRRKFGQKVEEPLKLQKHKVIAQAFAKRKEFQNQGRLSISFHNSHTDPVGLKFDMNSAVGSHDFSSTWANNLPRFVNRRYALTGCPSSSSHGHRRNSIDSISFSVRHVSVESRRNSNDQSQSRGRLVTAETSQLVATAGKKAARRWNRRSSRWRRKIRITRPRRLLK
jgi:smoothened